MKKRILYIYILAFFVFFFNIGISNTFCDGFSSSYTRGLIRETLKIITYEDIESLTEQLQAIERNKTDGIDWAAVGLVIVGSFIGYYLIHYGILMDFFKASHVNLFTFSLDNFFQNKLMFLSNKLYTLAEDPEKQQQIITMLEEYLRSKR